MRVTLSFVTISILLFFVRISMRILPLFRSFFFFLFFLYPSSRFLFEPSIDGQKEGERVE